MTSEQNAKMVMENEVKTLTKREEVVQIRKHRLLEILLKEKEKVAAVIHSHVDLPLPSSSDNSEEDDDQFVTLARSSK